jgi:hypothetical protein
MMILFWRLRRREKVGRRESESRGVRIGKGESRLEGRIETIEQTNDPVKKEEEN